RISVPLRSERTQGFNLGKYGEYLVSVLSDLEEKKLPNDSMPIHEATTSRDFYAQVNAWMNEISPGSTFDVRAIKEADSGIYTFSYRSKLGKTRSFRPTNVGFGLSYTLPILVALLTARKGSLTLIENPEAHLHPKAQLILGKLLGMCANAGAQLIVESHSDHVLNGIRIAVKDNFINRDDVVLHFINRPDELDISSTDILTPEIYENGKLSKWPDGFFDEWDNALDQLI
ncbi:AAA family ATPase, partial [Photobacterium halotolerans]